MAVHRLGQAEELLRGPGFGEATAVMLQVGFHTLDRHTGSVWKPAAELLLGAIGRERETARQCKALRLVSAPLAEPDDLPLQLAEADGHRVAPGGSADHDQAAHPVGKALGECQRNHPAVRGPHHRVEGLDSDLLAGGDDGRRLVDRRDRGEVLPPHRARGLAATTQPVETEDFEPLGVEGPPGTDLPLPPPLRVPPTRHIAACRNAAQHEDGRPARSAEPAESDRTGLEPLPAGERQAPVEPDLMVSAGKRAHALTGRPDPGSPYPTTVPIDWLNGAR